MQTPIASKMISRSIAPHHYLPGAYFRLGWTTTLVTLSLAITIGALQLVAAHEKSAAEPLGLLYLGDRNNAKPITTDHSEVRHQPGLRRGGAVSRNLPRPKADFIPNEGQFTPEVRFVAAFDDFVLSVENAKLSLQFGLDASGEPQRLSIEWINASADVVVRGEQKTEVAYSYVLGKNSKAWKSTLPSFERVRMAGIYPGVDLLIYEASGKLEFDYIIQPGVDPSIIICSNRGVESASVDSDGALLLASSFGKIELKKPRSYQNVYGNIEAVDSRYVIMMNNKWAIAVGSYDPYVELTIDPVFEYSRRVGGSGDDIIYSVVYDNAGEIYAIGETTSSDLPTTHNLTPSNKSNKSIFIIKYSKTLEGIESIIYIGGSGDDTPSCAAFVGGDLLIGGETRSVDFPGIPSYSQDIDGRDADGFMIRINLNNPGNSIKAIRLGGGGRDKVNAFTVDVRNSIYVVGDTSSVDFRTTNSSFGSAYAGGITNVFIAKINPDLGEVQWSSIYGGLGSDSGKALVIGSDETVWFTGSTTSAGLPSVRSAHGQLWGPQDCFLAQVSVDGKSLLTSTYIGDLGAEQCSGLAVDMQGNPIVVGVTNSANFTTTDGAFQARLGGDLDVFVLKMNKATMTLAYSTLVGGAGEDQPTSLVIDPEGRPCVTGYTSSSDFPLKASLQASLAGDADGFYFCLDTTAKQLDFSTYIGGKRKDRLLASKLSFDATVLLAGETSSEDFPSVGGILDRPLAGARDGVLASIDTYVGNIPPNNISVTPSFGASISADLTFSAYDGNGYESIKWVYALIHDKISPIDGCYIRYTVATNKFELLSSNGEFWSKAVYPGDDESVENDQCLVDASKSRVWGYGGRIDISFHYRFKQNFSGTKSLLMYTHDHVGIIAGWELRGGWVVPIPVVNMPAYLDMFSPSISSGTSSTIFMKISDADGVQDIVKIDTVIKKENVSVDVCHFRYERALGVLSLLQDDGVSWTSSVKPGTEGVLENSSCRLSLSAARLTLDEMSVSLAVPVSFKWKMGGRNNIWISISELGRKEQDPVMAGTVTVPFGEQFVQPVAGVVGFKFTNFPSIEYSVNAADSNGPYDISKIYLWIAKAGLDSNSCYIRYETTSNRISLLNDKADAWVADDVSGYPGILENSQCSIDKRTIRFSTGTAGVCLYLTVRLKDLFKGELHLKTFIQDTSGLVSGWHQKANILSATIMSDPLIVISLPRVE